VLVVNQYARPISVRFTDRPERALREYVYSRETVPTADGGLIPASGTLRVGADALLVAPQSFVVLADVD